jgi:hypothetical protein
MLPDTLKMVGVAAVTAMAVAVAAHDAVAQSTAGSPATPRVSRDFQVGAGTVWTSTDLELQPGDRLVFTANGEARCPGVESAFGPAGIPRGFRDLLRILPMAQAGRGALIGRVGPADTSIPFVIGASNELVTGTGGAFALGINRAENDPCDAGFSLHVDVYSPLDPAVVATAAAVDTLPGVDQELFARLSRRVRDKDGNPGDMVNFLILGSDDSMERVFRSAGWVTVDRDVKSALLTGVLNSLSKEAYLTLPMSQLYLFDRPQDFGWAHAEPIKVVASRHHLRVWKAPFQVDGSTVWVGAATHDIGFDRDRRNNGVTHKIDPQVDLERDFVEKTLTATGLVSAFTYFLPENPLRDAKTATGGEFMSDGRVLVLKVSDPLTLSSPSDGAR